tara:strand:- start:1833 stop:2927 length:1095 start_codon:yes stop_codon:yes gene_type:complete
MIKNKRIILSGGGTGGHIYPAISIANELLFRDKKLEILFVGAKDRMEMKIIPQYGYKILGLWISGLSRDNLFKNILIPIKLVVSAMQSFIIIRKFKPDIVVGTGGYASGPIVYVANLLNIPTLIQEQNSYPGITNKILSKRVNKICVAYENIKKYFPSDKVMITGNPVRSDILENADSFDKGLDFFGLDPNKKTMLVLGGSLGSREINKAIYSIKKYLQYINVQVIWQCGKLYYEEYKQKNIPKNLRLYDFLNNVGLAFSVSDFIISRAGASSISELSIVGKPVIFIPSPNVAENHQLKNAQEIVKNGGALMVEEKNINELKKKINELNSSSDLRNKLSKNIKKSAYFNAASDIVEEIKKLINQ